MNRRTEQIASTLQRAVQDVLARGLSDPRISGLVTVTGVVVAEDLATAEVSVSIYPEERESLSMHGLRAASRHIRRRVGDLVAMRQVPELTFRLDRTLKRQAEVLRAISKAVGEPPPDAPAPLPGPTLPEDRP
jgi:ribosome-binding factor A